MLFSFFGWRRGRILIFSVFKAIAFLIFVKAIVFPPHLQAQELEGRLQITGSNGQTLAYLSFQYGDQQGMSDENGVLELNYQPETSLRIQHLLTGTQTIAPDRLRNALQQEKLEVEINERMLQPVTVIEMRPRQGSESRLQVDADDRLTHDAGSFLQRDIAVSGIRKSGSYGFDPVIRGFKYDRLNVVIDGAQSVSAACPNRMDPPVSQVALNQMEAVEIIEGPHALRYGPVIGATINFISPRARFSDSLTFLGRAGSGYESNGGIQRYEAMGGLRSQNLEVKMHGSFSEGGDYSDGRGETVPSAFLRGSWGGALAYRLGDAHTMSLHMTRNEARDVAFAALPMDLREDRTTMAHLQHRYERPTKEGVLQHWHTTVYGSWVDHLMDNLQRPEAGRMADAQTEAQTRNYGGRTELRFDGARHWTYLGMDFRHEEATGTRFRTMRMGPMAGMTMEDNVWQDGRLRRAGLFTEHHRSLGAYQTVTSARLDWVRGTAGKTGEIPQQQYGQMDQTNLNPSLSVGAQRSLGRGYGIGVWMARSVRSAGLAERYIHFIPIGSDPYELIGNPQLQPEVNYQADLRFSYDRAHTHLSASGFVSRLDGFITSRIREDLSPRMRKAPGVRQFINLDRALMSGGSLRWRQYWASYLQTKMGLSYTHGVDLIRETPLPEIPPLEVQVQMGGHFFQQRLHPMVQLRHALRQGRQAGFFGESETPSFTVVDLVAGYRISEVVSAQAGVRNVLDEVYYEHLNRATVATDRPLFAPGRNLYLSLSAQLP